MLNFVFRLYDYLLACLSFIYPFVRSFFFFFLLIIVIPTRQWTRGPDVIRSVPTGFQLVGNPFVSVVPGGYQLLLSSCTGAAWNSTGNRKESKKKKKTKKKREEKRKGKEEKLEHV